MSTYKPENVSFITKNVESQKLILPAMQRNFVWPEDKICTLFESMMREYPISKNSQIDTCEMISFAERNSTEFRLVWERCFIESYCVKI